MIRKLEIKSLRIEKFIDTINIKDYIENERYIFNCKDDSDYYELILCRDFNKNIIDFSLTRVNNFTGISYLPKENMYIEIDEENRIINSNAFHLEKMDINIYYDNFIVTNRMKYSRVVWIMKGESGLGKSYLTATLINNSNLKSYETDTSKELPENIIEDIIVVGNKYNFSIEQIEEKIYGKHETIIVDFNKNI